MRLTPGLLVLATLASGCRIKDGVEESGVPTDDSAAPDGDGDGVPADEDCDDADPEVRPGAEDRCDGVDRPGPEDCDGATADDDLDGDGYGLSSDCDDGDGEVNPDADEVCDGVDRPGPEDCDGTIDDAADGCEDVVVSSDASCLDLAVSLGNPTTPVDVLVSVGSGVTITCGVTTSPAFTTGSLPQGSTVTLVNEGVIHGHGGDGACGYGGDGEGGGDAILATVDLVIDNANGFIFGGGGGGGAGDDPAGGGGGAGGGLGCNGGSSASGGDGGDGGARFGRIPGGQAANYDGSPGVGGLMGNPPTAGGGGSGGAAQTQVGSGCCSGQGGAGGGWGGGGGGGSTASGTARNPGDGGDAGYAVRRSGGSVTWISGYDLAHVKGDVQ